MALIRRAYISGVSRAWRRENGGGRESRECNSASSFEISQARMAGASSTRCRSRALEHSFFGDEGNQRPFSLRRGCSGVRNEIYEGPLFRHLKGRGDGGGRVRREKGDARLKFEQFINFPVFRHDRGRRVSFSVPWKRDHALSRPLPSSPLRLECAPRFLEADS